MIEALSEFDTKAFLFLNGLQCDALDWPMWVVSQHWSWAIVLVAAYAAMTLRKEPRNWWLVLAAGGLCFLLADQGANLIKNWVCRPRPCQVLEDFNHFHTECGVSFSFISNHAANAFALAIFLFLRYRKQMKTLPIIMFVWAFLTSYSRIYLGKHYPGDILCGALFGILVGWFVWWLIKYFEKKFLKNETKS